MYIDHSFGFQTAFSEAAKVIRLAHVEAKSAPNGVGLVKLMGRQSGFIACYASLPINDADFVLIPEVPFRLEGERGLLAAIRRRIEQRGHAVIVAAEGAGQDLCGSASNQTDASGNPRLHDVGLLLKQRITEDFASRGQELNLKYIDPSYTIRSVPANAYDAAIASGWRIAPCMPRCAAGRRCLSAAGMVDSCMCRCNWRFATATPSIRTAICGTPSWNRPASRARLSRQGSGSFFGPGRPVPRSNVAAEKCA